MAEITFLEVETGPAPTHAVIWLHGLGADATDFEPIVPELGLPESPALRFIFPNAPQRPVTCNGGYVMRAWYDIVSLAPESRQIDEAGLLESRDIVRQFIAREVERGIAAEHIFLAGFSQGGAVAYLAGLTHPEPLGGIVALSTYIPAPERLKQDFSAANRDTPVFAAHGRGDEVVSLALGERALAVLHELGVKPQWRLYDMGHSVCMEEIADLGAWFGERLQPAG